MIWFLALRPHHWIKNLFCLAGILFSCQIFSLEAWVRVVPVFAAFCLLSSSGYLLNDICNRAEDRRHPRKQSRAVTSGRLSVRVAYCMCICSGLSGLGLLYLPLASPLLFVVGLSYLTNAIFYSLYLRSVIIVDVVFLSLGFVFRTLAGFQCFDIPTPPSLLVCTFGFALLLAFGKRHGESLMLSNSGAVVGETRGTLKRYRKGILQGLILISLAIFLGGYFGYCVGQGASGRIWISWLPLIVGIVEYLRLAVRSENVENPELLFWSSPLLLLVAFSWLITVLYRCIE